MIDGFAAAAITPGIEGATIDLGSGTLTPTNDLDALCRLAHFNVPGPNGDGPIHAKCRHLKSGSGGTQQRLSGGVGYSPRPRNVSDYVHVTDLARAHLSALDSARGGSER